VQNSQRVIIVVAHQAGDIEALAKGTQLSWNNLETVMEAKQQVQR
jgi:hypothetical protein